MRDSFKYFEFSLSKFIGYRLMLEKSNFKHYCTLKYNGFEILLNRPDTFKFKIENQLVRRLKLKHLNNELKTRSVEHELWDLINKSIEINKPSESELSYYITCDYWYSEGTSGSIDRQEYKDRNRYDNRKFNQKLKSYESKSRFRK